MRGSKRLDPFYRDPFSRDLKQEHTKQMPPTHSHRTKVFGFAQSARLSAREPAGLPKTGGNRPDNPSHLGPLPALLDRSVDDE